jgi:hypothetical protein
MHVLGSDSNTDTVSPFLGKSFFAYQLRILLQFKVRSL